MLVLELANSVVPKDIFTFYKYDVCKKCLFRRCQTFKGVTEAIVEDTATYDTLHPPNPAFRRAAELPHRSDRSGHSRADVAYFEGKPEIRRGQRLAVT